MVLLQCQSQALSGRRSSLSIANPFVVGANNQWQQYVLSKYYNKTSAGEG